MKVYKFGGASVRDAEGVRNLADIIGSEKSRLFVIVSAMGKTTNAMERVLDSFYSGSKEQALSELNDVITYHNSIIEGLWDKGHVSSRLDAFYEELSSIISSDPGTRSYEEWYDRIVSYGELISTTIISEYLIHRGMTNLWVDMRTCFITNDRHKDASIDLDRSSELLLDIVNSSSENLFIGQGFIGATPDGTPTTIGREGSDYSAAVAGYILDAENVAIWKDVEGILNGDPKIFDDTRHIPELTYLDAIELAYSGAQIIHPKTIKPLQNKSIPLHVRSFLDKSKPGSVIKDSIAGKIDIPILILKKDQVLLTIRPEDFSFVLEEKLAEIFSLLEKYHVKVNLIQSSAVSLSLCMDSSRYLDEITGQLRNDGFQVAYNTEMELLTVRGYTQQQQLQYGDDPNAYMTQRTRRSLRVVRKTQKKGK